MNTTTPIRDASQRTSWKEQLILVLVLLTGGAPISLRADEHDPFEAKESVADDPFDQLQSPAPLDETIYYPPRPAIAPLQINFQVPPREQAQPDATIGPPVEASAPPKDPCAAAAEKPLGALGINIAIPSGDVPVDHAAACWQSLNQASGGLAGGRAWPGFLYNWDATAFCHRPLYFEEINLERYGYGCHPCLQPAASAAHFFGTVPALPYCMAAECPGECVYTLGHYQPGSCPPWRCHWPPCDPLAAAAEGGVLTGLIFLIP